MKVLVVRSEEGRVVESTVVESNLHEVVRSITQKALSEWDPAASDFTVLRAKYEIHYKLPVKPELVDMVRELGLDVMREGNELVVAVPVYTISFDNTWMDDSYMDKKMYVVALYLDEEAKRQIEEYSIEATREPKSIEYSSSLQLSLGSEELKALEEGLKELEQEEQEEKPKKGRTRRK